MKTSVSTDIQAPASKVWGLVTDIEGSKDRITGIEAIEIQERPHDGLVGLKWKETRTMFGKAATEVMWVTACDEGRSYDVRAESHGAVYTTRIIVDETDSGSRLTWEFEGLPQTTGAKILWALTGWMVKGSMRKALQKDVDDIKAAAEA